MFIYQPNFRPSRGICIIGCGGTGARIVPPIVQLFKQASRVYNPAGVLLGSPPPIFLVDGDVVEEKNLARQHFTSADVGKNKAEVLAKRYSKQMGYPHIYYSTSYVDSVSSIFLKMEGEAYQTLGLNHSLGYGQMIFVLGVDSAKARRQILMNIMRQTRSPSVVRAQEAPAKGKCLIIDAGNEDDFGQVSMFNNLYFAGDPASLKAETESYFPKRLPVPFSLNAIPMPVHDYVARGATAQQLSCADLPQTLAVNNLAASLVVGMVQNALFLKSTSVLETHFHLTQGLSSNRYTVNTLLDRAVTPSTLQTHPLNPEDGTDEAREIQAFARAMGGYLSGADQNYAELYRACISDPTSSRLYPGVDSNTRAPGAPSGLLAMLRSVNTAALRKMRLKVEKDGTLVSVAPPPPPPPPLQPVAPAPEATIPVKPQLVVLDAPPATPATPRRRPRAAARATEPAVEGTIPAPEPREEEDEDENG